MLGEVQPAVCFELSNIVEDTLNIVADFSQELRADEVAVIEFREDVILAFLCFRSAAHHILLVIYKRSAQHAD